MTIPKRTQEIIDEQMAEVRFVANTGPMNYKAGGSFQGLLVEAMVDNDRIGFLTAEKLHDDTYTMNGIFVEPEYRQNGIAMEMVRKAHDTVPMTPYLMTENQKYDSDEGRKVAEKEYRIFTAAIAAIPEIAAIGGEALGAGGAAAGAGEAAAGGSGLGGSLLRGLGVHELFNHGGGGGGGSSSGSSSGGGDDGTGGFATPANPTTGSVITSWVQTTVPMPGHTLNDQVLAPIKELAGSLGRGLAHETIKDVSDRVKDIVNSQAAPATLPKPSTLPGFAQPAPSTTNTGDQKGTNVKIDTGTLREAPKAEPAGTGGGSDEIKKPTATPPEQPTSNGQDRPSGGGGSHGLTLDIPHPITNFATPANPRGASVDGDSRLLGLIDELYDVRSPHSTTWE